MDAAQAGTGFQAGASTSTMRGQVQTQAGTKPRSRYEPPAGTSMGRYERRQVWAQAGMSAGRYEPEQVQSRASNKPHKMHGARQLTCPPLSRVADKYEPAGTSSTAGFVPYRGNDGSWQVLPATGTGSVGSGVVWENPTCGLPVSNPIRLASGSECSATSAKPGLWSPSF